MKLLLSLLLLLTMVNAEDKLSTAKTSCIQQSLYPNKTLDEQKKILIEKAKQESLEELYGTLISSSTDIQDGKMMSDSIKSRAVGAVRVDGNPSFYNGMNLGEICTDVKVYITKKDLEKYSPKKVSLTHYCFNDSAVAMKDIKQEAKYGAYKEIISQYKPSMKVSGKDAEQFIHGFIISNDEFDFDTASYCFNAVGTVLPYELEIQSSSPDKSLESTNQIIPKIIKPAGTKILAMTGDGSQLKPYDISIQNQEVKYKKNDTYSWFKFTLDKAQIVNFYENGDPIYLFNLLNSDMSQIDRWSSEATVKLEEGTYLFKIESNGASGNASFNILFGSDLSLNNIPGYEGDIAIKNQEVKYKKMIHIAGLNLRLIKPK